MENFYVYRRILSNGAVWSEILKKCNTGGKQYIAYRQVRDAWHDMERCFCSETVMGFISALDKVVKEEDDFSPEVLFEEVNRVVVKFSCRKDPRYETVVEYVGCGKLTRPELVYSE